MIAQLVSMFILGFICALALCGDFAVALGIFDEREWWK